MKNKLELKHLACYLPYKLRVQYYGIINGKELSEYNKKYNEENGGLSVFDEDATCFNPPEEVMGLKEGYLKIVEAWDCGATYMIGIKHHGLKKCYGYEGDFKPILRPLSDLAKFGEDTINEHSINTLLGYDGDIEFSHYKGVLSFIIDADPAQYYDSSKTINFEIVEMVRTELLKGHFDVFNLIEKGLAIDINTLNPKP